MNNPNNKVVRHCLRINGLLVLAMFATAVAFVLCFSYSTSPLYFHDGYDSAIFQSMGLALLKGKIPYVDLFDHKGPILYFINALGLWIGGGKIGIVYLQIMANTISFFFMYRILRLFIDAKYSVAVFSVLLVFYALFYREGAHCEEWMLTCVSTSLYISLKDFFTPPTDRRLIFHSAYYGFCLAICSLIRPNDAVIYIGGLMFGVILWLLIRQQYKRIFQNAAVMVCAYVICVMPCILFYAHLDALDDMWYALIIYNSKYARGITGFMNSIISPTKVIFYITLLAATAMVGIKEKPTIILVLVTQTALAWILTGERFERHYLISTLPLISFVGIAVIYWKKISIRLFLLAVIGLIIASIYKPDFALAQWDKAKRIAHNYYVKQTMVYPFYAESEKLFSYIPPCEQDQIWNYNLGFWGKPYSSIFIHHGVLQCNRVPYYRMVFIDEKLRKSDDIKQKTPKWLMLSRDKEMVWLFDDWQRQDYEYIMKNYDFVAQTDSSICEIELWRRKP